jgi:putative flippase GtrA
MAPPPDSSRPAAVVRFGRLSESLRRRGNWTQLVQFCFVGAVGYAINFGVYAFALDVLSFHYIPAAILSFAVAVTNNYALNRAWTFRGQRGHLFGQGARFLVVSVAALLANLAVLHFLVVAGLGEKSAQAVAIILVTPVNFIGNKLWSFRR